ncbi:hypothetical protein EJ06DRAFT_302196 [Trichodelitschia bisporula]|uniref:Uncharacterized protein n=1 Tax=Trichodelitschia bisporula TaxID=703511 RepID=A0A6G1I739_9PEZI|nr:hypothetical protein EJ06DRAFT_302196 [Trichodelitschia bisporula]
MCLGYIRRDIAGCWWGVVFVRGPWTCRERGTRLMHEHRGRGSGYQKPYSGLQRLSRRLHHLPPSPLLPSQQFRSSHTVPPPSRTRRSNQEPYPRLCPRALSRAIASPAQAASSRPYPQALSGAIASPALAAFTLPP